MARKKATVKTKRDRYWQTQIQTARLLDITVQSFIRWDVKPIKKTKAYTYYRMSDVVANRVVNERKKLTKSIGNATEAELLRSEREEKLLLVKAQREGQELKNSQLRKELAPVAIIEWTLGKVGSQIAAILDSLPLQIKKRSPKLTASGIEVIRREIVKTQNIAAQVQVDYDEYKRSAE